MKKRILAAILSTAMIFSTIPVYAETGITEEDYESTSELLEAEGDVDLINTEENTVADVIEEESIVNETEDSFADTESDLAGEIEYEDSENEFYLSEIATPSSIIYENYLGEITEGQSVDLEKPNAGKEYQVSFKVPTTKRYRIYLLSDAYYKYNDSIILYDQNNNVIEGSNDESWYLTKGDTVTINVTCAYSYDQLSLRVIEYIGIERITGDCPEYAIPHGSCPVTVHLYYTDGTSRDLSYRSWYFGFDPVKHEGYDPILHKRVSVDIVNRQDITCTIDNKTVILGQVTALGFRDSRIYQINKAGTYTIKREDLFNGNAFCLLPSDVDGYERVYYLTIKGNVSNDFLVYGNCEEKGLDSSEKTENGVLLTTNLYSSEAKLINFHDDTENSVYTITITKSINPVSINIGINKYTCINGDITNISASVQINYEDGFEETIPVEMGSNTYKSIITSKGYDISLNVSSYYTPGVFVLSANTLGCHAEKGIVLLPDGISKDTYDSVIELNQEVEQISLPALKDHEYYLVKIHSSVDRTYYLNAEANSLYFSVLEDNGKELIYCYSEYKNDNDHTRVHFENGKTYYLLCQNKRYSDQESSSNILLEGFFSSVEFINPPASVSSIKDIENVKILAKHSYGESMSIPLLKDGKFNLDDIESYDVFEFDNVNGYWEYSDLTQDDVLDYLTTGNVSGFKEGNPYRLSIRCKDFWLHFDFTPKANTPGLTGGVTINYGLLGNAKIDVIQGGKLIKTVVNANGSYTVSDLEPDTYTIHLSADGYITKELQVTVGDEPVSIDTKLWKIADAAALCEASLSLEGQIGVNLIVNISEAMLKDSGAYAELTQEGNTNPSLKVKLTDATVDTTTGNRVFTYPVAAKEVNDKVTIKIYSGSGEQLPLRGKADRSVELSGDKYSYAAADYINSKKNSLGTLGSLMKALNDYGTATEKYFQYGSMGSAGILGDLSSVNQTVLSPYKAVGSGDRLDGVSISASLMLESMTSINVNYAITGNVADYTFTRDGKKVTPVKVGTEYQVTVSDIAAKDLDQMHVFSITDKSGKTQTVKYSALSYAYSKVNSTGDVSTVAKTLYLYNQAAKGYFG